RSSSFPTWGPFPCVSTSGPSAKRRSAGTVARRLARCSAAVPRSPFSSSAFPPSATTVSVLPATARSGARPREVVPTRARSLATSGVLRTRAADVLRQGRGRLDDPARLEEARERGLADLLEPVRDPEGRFVELD